MLGWRFVLPKSATLPLGAGGDILSSQRQLHASANRIDYQLSCALFRHLPSDPALHLSSAWRAVVVRGCLLPSRGADVGSLQSAALYDACRQEVPRKFWGARLSDVSAYGAK